MPADPCPSPADIHQDSTRDCEKSGIPCGTLWSETHAIIGTLNYALLLPGVGHGSVAVREKARQAIHSPFSFSIDMF